MGLGGMPKLIKRSGEFSSSTRSALSGGSGGMFASRTFRRADRCSSVKCLLLARRGHLGTLGVWGAYKYRGLGALGSWSRGVGALGPEWAKYLRYPLTSKGAESHRPNFPARVWPPSCLKPEYPTRHGPGDT